jgi:TPR repeat protein
MRALLAVLLLVAGLAPGAAEAAGSRVLGGDIFTLGGPDRGLAADELPARFSLRAITDERHLAELGHVGAQYNLGVMYTINERYRAAEHWYRKAALRGHREASYNLGVLYLNGQGVAADEALAKRWFTAAADRGLPEAHYQLGRLYYAGRGSGRDPDLERDHYRKAAEGGYPLAQHDLGVIFHLGEGVPRDDVEAFAWFAAADASGFDSRDALAVVRANLTPSQLTEAAARAATYVERYSRR